MLTSQSTGFGAAELSLLAKIARPSDRSVSLELRHLSRLQAISTSSTFELVTREGDNKDAPPSLVAHWFLPKPEPTDQGFDSLCERVRKVAVQVNSGTDRHGWNVDGYYMRWDEPYPMVLSVLREGIIEFTMRFKEERGFGTTSTGSFIETFVLEGDLIMCARILSEAADAEISTLPVAISLIGVGGMKYITNHGPSGVFDREHVLLQTLLKPSDARADMWCKPLIDKLARSANLTESQLYDADGRWRLWNHTFS